MSESALPMDVSEAEARRRLHEWLAERVMGWMRAGDREGDGPADEFRWFDPTGGVFWWIGGPADHPRRQWEPSERIEDAWRIVDRLIALYGPFFELTSSKYRWECALDLGEWDPQGNWVDQSIRRIEDTPALAICSIAEAVYVHHQKKWK